MDKFEPMQTSCSIIAPVLIIVLSPIETFLLMNALCITIVPSPIFELMIHKSFSLKFLVI